MYYKESTVIRSKITILPLPETASDDAGAADAAVMLVQGWLSAESGLIVQTGALQEGASTHLQPLLPGLSIDNSDARLGSLLAVANLTSTSNSPPDGMSMLDGLVLVILPPGAACPPLPAPAGGLASAGVRLVAGSEHLFVCAPGGWGALARNRDASREFREVMNGLARVQPDARAVAVMEERASMKVSEVPSRGGIASSASPRVGATKIVFTLVHADVRSFGIEWEVDRQLQQFWPGLLADVARVHNDTSVVSQVVYSRGALQNATTRERDVARNTTKTVLRQSQLLHVLNLPSVTFSSPADLGAASVYHFVM